MEKDPLITVIVPVYKTGQYLDKCVDSIVNQTYENMEIILVDDGSPDDSGEICDQWKEKDPRIKVIHKKNGGLSDARNAGMEAARGDYIGFVDSDDYIAPDMYETLLDLSLKNNAPLACARYDVFGENVTFKIPEPDGMTDIMSDYKMLTLLVWPWLLKKHYANMSVWDRLYRKDIIEDVRFPVGRIYEDIEFSMDAVHNAGTVAYINKAVYHYRISGNSITGQDCISNDRWISDRYPGICNQIRQFDSYGYHDLAVMAKYRAYMDLYKIRHVCSDPEKKKEIDRTLRQLRVSPFEIYSSDPEGIVSKLKYAVKALFMGPYTKYKVGRKNHNVRQGV